MGSAMKDRTAPETSALFPESELHPSHGPVLISACLLGIPWRWHGRRPKTRDKLIARLKKKYVLVPVCPEQLGGPQDVGVTAGCVDVCFFVNLPQHTNRSIPHQTSARLAGCDGFAMIRLREMRQFPAMNLPVRRYVICFMWRNEIRAGSGPTRCAMCRYLSWTSARPGGGKENTAAE